MRRFIALGIFMPLFALISNTAFATILPNDPTTKWTILPYPPGTVSDYTNDQQTGTEEADIVGEGNSTGMLAGAYIAFNPGTTATNGSVGFRARVGADTSPPGFKADLSFAIDGNADGVLDLFVTVDNSGSPNAIRIFKAGTGANISPSTTSIDTTPLFTYTEAATNYDFEAVTTNSDPRVLTSTNANPTDLDGGGNTDFFVSYFVPFADIVSALAQVGITNVTTNSKVRFVVATSGQPNSLNQDIGGLNGGVNSTTNYTNTGAITPPVTFDGQTNRAPVAVADIVSTPEDTPVTIPVLANDLDADGDPLTITSVTSTNGTVSIVGTNVLFTPSTNYNGPVTLTYIITDGNNAFSTNTVSVTVTPVNDAPVTANDSYSVSENTPLTVTAPGVLSNDTDVDSLALKAVLVTGPANGVLNLNTNGSFTYTPNTNFYGTDTFTYRANDGLTNGNTATVTITVIRFNRAPVANPDSYAVDQDTTLNVSAPGVLLNDTDADTDPLAAIYVSGPSHGTLTLNTNGSFIYTPTPGYVGPDTFTYQAYDGFTNSPTATVSIDVRHVNHAPKATNDVYTTACNTLLTVVAPGVLANDLDPDGDPLAAYIVTNAANGVVTLNTNGGFTYSPNASFTGTDTFTYAATDGSLSNNATVTITVTDSTAPQLVGVPSDTIVECSAVPGAATVTATDNCDPNPSVSLNENSTQTANGCGHANYTITRTWTATDASGNSLSATQVITVHDTTAPAITTFPNDTTVTCASAVPAADNTAVVATDLCGTVTISHDADVVSSSNCVNHLTITRVYHATDACGNASSRTQTITVNNTNAPTITSFPADATYGCSSAVPSANDSLVSATDACGGGVTVSHAADVITAGACANRYSIARTYTVTDVCGNSASQTQTITVNNTNAPTIAAFPADATFTCSSAVPSADDSLVSGTDACGGSVTVSHAADVITAGACANRYSIARTYTVTDSCGNSASQTQTITVNNTTAPSITSFPADASYSCASGVPAADDTLVSGTDGCGGGVTVSHAADVISGQTCANRYSIARTYTVTDSCGNSFSKTQTITVNDTTAPTITTFPSDATVTCVSAVPAADDSAVAATDGCGGTVTISHDADVVTSSNCVSRLTIARVYRATDVCGNATSQTQTITVDNTTAPSITSFPANATFTCASAVPAADDTLVSATDACGGGVTVTHAADVISGQTCANRYSIARTYTATDACGNSTTQTQTITVNNTNAPTITSFPTDATFTCASAVPAANDSLVSGTDACGGSVTVTHAADVISGQTCANRYSIARTYTVTDSCGNTASQTQTITVNNTNAPTITSFPADATFTCSSAVPAANDSLVSGTDACGGGVTVSHADDVITAGVCANRYSIARTYTVTDSCGNTLSQTQTITVNNTTAPTITSFPADATVSCSSSVPAANDSLVGGTDACGGGVTVTHAADVISGQTCANRYSIARAYTVTDSCGNSTSRTQTITVNDTTAPTITTFPNDTTVTCASAVPAANDSSVVATDGCGGTVTISHDADVVTSSNCVSRLTIARVYRATDVCGNATSRTQTITVDNTTAPSITSFPANATYTCASAVPAANDGLVSATDACGGGVTVTHAADVISGQTCANRYSIARTYTATDACGNSASQTQTIVVNNTNAPTITSFPADATYTCASAVPAANDSLVAGTDACGGGVSVSHAADVITAGACANRYTIARTYTVTDTCGNSASQTQTITVNNTTAPTITSFPADATFSCSSAVPAANDSLVTGTDACGGGVTVTHAADVISGQTCANRYTIARAYTVTDSCGNSISQTQTITVNDTAAPTFSNVPADTTAQCDNVPAPQTPTATDNCGGSPTITFNETQTNGAVVGQFVIVRTWTATDACGNSASVSQHINGTDSVPPQLVGVPSDVTVECTGVPTAPTVTATDNCDPNPTVNLNETSTQTNSGCGQFSYTITRTWTASDASGNTKSATQTITVQNTAAPTITSFPANATYACSSAVPAANDSLVSATNACGGATTVTHSPDVITAGGCPNRYSIARTYTVTDACGNSANRMQTITVNNTNAPTITSFPADATYSCANAVPAANDGLVSATDACGGSATISHAADAITAGSCANRYSIARTYTATDSCGNTASQTQTITVNNTSAPTITSFPADASYSCSSSVPAANDSLVSGTDACGGSVTVSHSSDVISGQTCANRYTIARTYTVTDSCGNTLAQTQTITVNDVTAPTITGFPADATFTCASSVPAANDGLVTAADGCGGLVTVSHDADVITSSNCASHLTIARVYRATDVCGNATSRTQTITVNNTSAPTITSFPANATYTCSSSVPSADDSLVSATDACGGGVTVTHAADVISGQQCANRYSIARTYTATDACGNTASRTQTITVNNTTLPTITSFPADATYNCASAVPAADDSLVSASDACGGAVTVTHNADAVTPGSCANNYTIARTYNATDACGNTAVRTQNITVSDTSVPTISSFPADATYSCASAVPAADDTSVIATDGCGGAATITHDADVISGQSCANRYTITRTYRATSACGNIAKRSQTITVDDLTGPILSTVPASTTAQCDSLPDAPTVTATDNCGGNPSVQFSQSTAPGTNADNYFIIRTWTATDACGNTSTAQQTISVVDTIAPVLAGVPDPVTVQCGSVPAPAPVTATDNCDPNPMVSLSQVSTQTGSGLGQCEYTVTRTWTATDIAGNTSSATQVITVVYTPYAVTNDAYNITAGSTLTVPAPGVLANDSNPDNRTITVISYTQPSHGNVIVNPDGSFTYTPTAGYSGPDSFNYTATDGITTASGTVSITVVGNVTPTFIVVAGGITLNGQTGLYEQRVTVTNTSGFTVPALRVTVSNLPTGVTLYNSSGTSNGVPYVHYNAPVDSNASITMILEFYDPTRKSFTDKLNALADTLNNTGAGSASGIHINNIYHINGRIFIEFPSIIGRTYLISYSDDGMETWKAASPTVTAASTLTQWYDDGPPKTEPLTRSRQYRATLISTAP